MIFDYKAKDANNIKKAKTQGCFVNIRIIGNNDTILIIVNKYGFKFTQAIESFFYFDRNF